MLDGPYLLHAPHCNLLQHCHIAERHSDCEFVIGIYRICLKGDGLEDHQVDPLTIGQTARVHRRNKARVASLLPLIRSFDINTGRGEPQTP